jgi:hypothetical protein
MQLLTNETIRDAIKPWLTFDPEFGRNKYEPHVSFGNGIQSRHFQMGRFGRNGYELDV